MVSIEQTGAGQQSDLEVFANVVKLDLDDPEEKEHAEAMMQDDLDMDDEQVPPAEDSMSFESAPEFDSEDDDGQQRR